MARLIDAIPKLEKEKSVLLNALFAQRFPQVLTLVSADASRMLDLAWALAQALVCEDESAPCGQCGVCSRIEAKQSESILLIEPKGLTVKVDQVREVLDFISLKVMGRARVVIFQEAEHLGLQAANSLLKTLEEPTEKTYFLLLTNSRESLLPTIRSRTQVLRLPSERPVDGSLQDRTQALDALIAMLSSHSVVLPELIAEVKGSAENSLQWTLWWQQFLRDGMILSLGSQDPLLHEDLRLSLVRLQSFSVDKLLACSQNIFQLEQDIKGHVDRTLAFENFGLNIQEVRA